MYMKRMIAFLLVLCLLMSFQVGAFAANIPFYEDSQAIARAAESVLLLTCYDNEGNAVATGSGFLAFEDGIIVTNYHVIDGITGPIKANTEDGMYFDINEILCYDQVADVAILKTNARTRLDLLTLASTSTLGKGSRVVAIGSPLGLLNIVSEGIYSGIVIDETEYILFTAAISSGSSGGALFNENGEVIGVTAATYTEGQNLNLAVPIENVRKLWNQYQSGEYVETAPIEQTKTTEKAGGEEAFLTAEQYYEEEKYTEAVEWYMKAAKEEHAEAQYMLGECYYDGTGVEQDYSIAVEWYKRASKQGLSQAQYCLGYSYYKGEGVKQDYKLAVKYFSQAAEQGHAKAQRWLSLCYYDGEGVEVDMNKALELILQAINNGDVWANGVLGAYYQEGKAVEQNYEKGFEYILKAAELGNPDAQNWVGDLYREGIGTTKNDRLAVRWYEKAAGQGIAESQYMLGECYYNGYGVTRDEGTAAKWYTKAAEQGYGLAQEALGRCYAWGQGVQIDYSKAMEWLTMAAEQGYNRQLHMFLISAKYDMDMGNGRAEEKLLAAAEAGFAEAQCALGNLLYFGKTGRKDYNQAVYWYEKAVEQNHAEACYRLGGCYEYGMGVEKDIDKANELYAKASQLGYRH